jgi:hypothetical protein
MTSKVFESQYAGSECIRCHGIIRIGDRIRFLRPHSKEMEHEFCPGNPKPVPPPSPPPGSSTREEIPQREGWAIVGMWVPESKVAEAINFLKLLRSGK